MKHKKKKKTSGKHAVTLAVADMAPRRLDEFHVRLDRLIAAKRQLDEFAARAAAGELVGASIQLRDKRTAFGHAREAVYGDLRGLLKQRYRYRGRLFFLEHGQVSIGEKRKSAPVLYAHKESTEVRS